jgi:hypothetical protein
VLFLDENRIGAVGEPRVGSNPAVSTAGPLQGPGAEAGKIHSALSGAANK